LQPSSFLSNFSQTGTSLIVRELKSLYKERQHSRTHQQQLAAEELDSFLNKNLALLSDAVRQERASLAREDKEEVS
jgi:hypothetical protein